MFRTLQHIVSAILALVGTSVIQSSLAQSTMSAGQAAGFAAGGSLPASAANSINSATANGLIPQRASTPTPTNLTNQFGGSSLATMGEAQNANCDAQGINMAGGLNATQCNASNVIRNNTNTSSFAPGDNVTHMNTVFNINDSLGPTVGNQTCTQTTYTNPAVSQQETCNVFDSRVTQTCINAVTVTFTQATGCTYGQYMGSMTFTGLGVSREGGGTITNNIYCAQGGFSVNSHFDALTGSVPNDHGGYDGIYTNGDLSTFIPTSTGANVSNTLLGDMGSALSTPGFTVPLWYSLYCSPSTCDVTLTMSIPGSQVSFAYTNGIGSGSFQTPTPGAILNESWSNNCGALDALTQ